MPHCPYAPSPLFPWVMGHIGDGAAKCQMMSSCQKDVYCQKNQIPGLWKVHKKINWHNEINTLTSILKSHMMVTKNPQSVHRKYFRAILVTFIFDVKLDINICKPYYVNLLFLWTSFIVQRFDFFDICQLDIFLTIWHLFDNLTFF